MRYRMSAHSYLKATFESKWILTFKDKWCLFINFWENVKGQIIFFLYFLSLLIAPQSHPLAQIRNLGSIFYLSVLLSIQNQMFLKFDLMIPFSKHLSHMFLLVYFSVNGLTVQGLQYCDISFFFNKYLLCAYWYSRHCSSAVHTVVKQINKALQSHGAFKEVLVSLVAFNISYIVQSVIIDPLQTNLVCYHTF